ncbi:MAG: NAD-binding protein, partial [Gemmatimonadaceae bacterium]|nr:NAD-binding protein [Gemmatimonadaceae bacterium]
REAATGAAVVLSMVRDDAASRTVWFGHDAAAADGAMPASTVHRDGALAGLGADAIALESSTVTPAWIATLGAAVTARGATLLDAPVVGSRPQAEAGQLVHLVGDATAFARAQPLLAVLGGAAHHVGALGAGATTKLVVNALFAVQVAAVAELLRLGATHGLDRARTVEVLKGAMALMQAGADAPQFPIELVVKDLAYAVALGEGVPVQPAMTAAAHAVFAAAAAQGLGDRNITAVRLLSSSA